MSFLAFMAANGPEIARAAAEHVALVAAAIGIAGAVGVPLGIVLTRRPALAKPVLGFANVAQTIPSLALFGFLIPLNLTIFGLRLVGGIGPGTAIAALALYALLPIVRNAYTGIEGVDPNVREAGRAMGMTSWQLLKGVELPLALPVIVAGVRVATVITVGTATVAAAIDAGGLGKFIFRGLRMADDAQILAGAVPAALIALAADLLFGALERALTPGAAPALRRGLLAATAAAVAATIGVATFRLAAPPPAADRVVVGAKDFTEQLVLGELVAQALEARGGLPVERRFDLGGSLAHQALVAGEIDVYVEYSGTALMAILKDPPMTDPRAVRDRVAKAYAERFDLTWSEPLGFDNTFAILVRGADARRLGLRTISDAARHAPRWRAGFGPDFMVRADGYAAFARAYGLRFAGPPREMDLSLTYRALRDGQVDLVAGNATDGLIARYGLVQLEDDRRFFPPYDAAPVVRGDVVRRHPRVRAALADLGGRVDVAEMRDLNDAVDVRGQTPKAAVAAFLKREGLAP